MNDSSTVTENRGAEAGGVMVGKGSILTMHDSATITRNTAYARLPSGELGGGIYAITAAASSASSARPKANANVYDNSPDDCHS